MGASLGKWPSLAALAVSELLALALWFSASAVVPALQREAGLSAAQASAFTSAVQMGFVAGTLASALLGLADRLDPRRFFGAAAATAAIANAGILLFDPSGTGVLVLRFVTGACMAGIYPVGMRLAATWAAGDLGLLVGILVGALTLGSASPHLFNAFGGVDWRFTIGATSVSALVAGAAIQFAGIGPKIAPAPRFAPGFAIKAWTTPSLRLANLGYLGHMWELYAMWAWIVVFLDASFKAVMAAGEAALWAKVAAFCTVGAGALGSLLGGLFADRWGRTTLTVLALAASGTCALVVGFLFAGPPLVLTALCMVWGLSVVADSAQFSASVAELSDRAHVGTMLTVQTCGGFLLTLLTIHLVPWVADGVGWRYAFAILALGPAVGILAMLRLRASPDAVKLAGGRR